MAGRALLGFAVALAAVALAVASGPAGHGLGSVALLLLVLGIGPVAGAVTLAQASRRLEVVASAVGWRRPPVQRLRWRLWAPLALVLPLQALVLYVAWSRGFRAAELAAFLALLGLAGVQVVAALPALARPPQPWPSLLDGWDGGPLYLVAFGAPWVAGDPSVFLGLVVVGLLLTPVVLSPWRLWARLDGRRGDASRSPAERALVAAVHLDVEQLEWVRREAARGRWPGRGDGALCCTGLLALLEARPEEALAHFRAAVAVEPRNPVGWAGAAFSLASLGDGEAVGLAQAAWRAAQHPVYQVGLSGCSELCEALGALCSAAVGEARSVSPSRPAPGSAGLLGAWTAVLQRAEAEVRQTGEVDLISVVLRVQGARMSEPSVSAEVP